MTDHLQTITSLKNIISHINKIDWFLRSVDLEGFRSNQILIDYVLNNLDAISTAAGEVSAETRLLNKRIKWHTLANLRQIATRADGKIDPEMLWELKLELSKMQRKVQKVLDKLKQDE